MDGGSQVNVQELATLRREIEKAMEMLAWAQAMTYEPDDMKGKVEAYIGEATINIHRVLIMVKGDEK